MRKTLKGAIAAILITTTALAAIPVQAGERARANFASEPQEHGSVLTIPANAKLPIVKQVGLGAGKSLMVQFPTPLKDVLVADPKYMDAVVQSSNQVFLIAKQPGATNAFFFDQNGQQVLTIEVTIGADMGGLESLLRRLIPGSNISLETAGRSVVLLGSVRTPLDSQRASDLAREFVRATKGMTASNGSSAMASPAGGANGTQISLTTQSASANGGADGEFKTEKAVINMLSVDGEEQVQLRVHVAEVSRSVMKQFGINIGAQINAGSFATSLLTQNALPLTAAAGLGSLAIPGIGTEGSDAANALPCSAAGKLCNYNKGPGKSFGGSGTAGQFDLGGGNRISQTMQALERDGLIRTLAEPNLTAISGESAKFLAGGEFPIPTIDGTGQISVTFKEFGIGVAFTPIVLSEGRISLKIETEVSELSTEGAVTLNNIVIPALSKRQAKSTIELPSGGSIALAGLISDKSRQNIDGFPGLKDLPVLGTLFRSKDFIKEETELVIIVTPYLVKPTARQNLSLPSDGLAEASDLRGNLLGHLNRVYGKTSAQPVGDLKGDYGFIVD